MPVPKENKTIVLGTVIEALPNTTFKVALEGDKRIIIATLAGKMRLYRIKVMVGNKIKAELDPYNENKGRIIQRL